MSVIKVVCLGILCTTTFSLFIFCLMKFIEIQDNYPRDEFCLTCPVCPPGFFRNVEKLMDFNILVALDFGLMLMIGLIFTRKNYYDWQFCLVFFNFLRFMCNASIAKVTGFVPIVLIPIMKENCGLGGTCSNEKILPATLTGILYSIYYVIVLINFIVCVLMANSCGRVERFPPVESPAVVHTSRRVRRTRPSRRISPSSPSPPPSNSSDKRSPSPPKLMTVVYPDTKLTKYEGKDSKGIFSFRNSKNKVMPLTIHQNQPLIMA